MPSRMDLSWSEKNNNEQGVLQATQLYLKAASVYDEMIT
jgi:hypothetical protein